MENSSPEPEIQKLPSLLGSKITTQGPVHRDLQESIFYTCPQCGHSMTAKKCKIVCRHCHYFIGCVE